jgi:oxygen-independent coproporphyrinogen-3 oxidase
VQSLSPAQLSGLGRIHSVAEVHAAVAELRSAGLDNFNLDLMYGLPGQTLAEALDDLQQAVALAPAHLSHYQLTLEPGTAFYHRPPALPDDELAFEMQLACQARLAAAGYRQYEISGYARPDRQCRHNLNYWRFGDYLGIGAGAHGKATVSGVVIRTEKPRSPREYNHGAGRRGALRSAVPHTELAFEYMLNVLRLAEGFTLAEFERATGQPASIVRGQLDAQAARGLIEASEGRFRPTVTGFRFLNELIAAFLPDEKPRPGLGELYTATSRLVSDKDFHHFVSEMR